MKAFPGWSILVAVTVAACARGGGSSDAASPALSDSAFALLQARGAVPEAMGVDQYTSTHRFDDLPNGGRIELQSEGGAAEEVEQIRRHLRQISSSFGEGDFSIPAFVHDRAEVPGTVEMSARRSEIEYEFRELPRGGEVWIRTSDEAALRAVHEFLAFQRGDHRAHGHEGH